MNEQPTYKTIDKFDRLLGALHELPDVTQTKATTVNHVVPILGATQTFIVQTLRQREVGDHIFLVYVDDNGSTRIAIPPPVADAIARQRESLTTKVRKRIGKEQAQARKARGEVPAFMKAKKKKTKKSPGTPTQKEQP